jgi:hypothetical protein
VETSLAPTTNEYLPAPQLWQVLSDAAPSADEYFPTPQLKHSLSDAAPTETFHSKAKPAATILSSVSKLICMKPVVETYSVFRFTERPDSFSISLGSAHSSEVQLLTVTKSWSASVAKKVKRMAISPSEAITHEQSRLLP